MNRFVLAATLAAVGAIGSAGQAHAQYVYGYNTVNPYNGSLISNRGVYTPFGSQASSSYYNPYTGAAGQRYQYQNPYGTNVYRSSGYNPYYGRGYSNGSYYPGFGVSPYAGNFYRFRY